MNQYLDKLFHNRFKKKSLNTMRFKKHTNMAPFMLPAFKATVVMATRDFSRSAALSSALNIVSKGRISFVLLSDLGKVDTLAVTEPVLDGRTFQQNAWLKARHYARQTRRPCIAEEHGLLVRALKGRPGVLSHSYGWPRLLTGHERAQRIIDEMKGVKDRRCAYCLSICLARPDRPEFLHWEGHVKGEVAHRMGGGRLDYQSIIHVRGLGRTLSELQEPEKFACSFWRRCTDSMRDDWGKICGFRDMDGEGGLEG